MKIPKHKMKIPKHKILIFLIRKLSKTRNQHNCVLKEDRPKKWVLSVKSFYTGV